MFRKRAQAAMEFLMTYGWAILVVLAAIGALAYFGVLSPGNLLPQKCEFTSGFDCTEEPDGNSAAGAQYIRFPVTNSKGYAIDNIVFSSSTSCTGPVAIYDTDGTTVIDTTGTTIPNGDSFIVQLGGCAGLTSGQRFKEDVVITYDSPDSGMTHTVTGLVSGKAR